MLRCALKRRAARHRRPLLSRPRQSHPLLRRLRPRIARGERSLSPTLGESGQLSRGAPARARSDAAPRSAGWLASGELPTPPSSCGTSSRRSIGARGAPTTPPTPPRHPSSSSTLAAALRGRAARPRPSCLLRGRRCVAARPALAPAPRAARPACYFRGLACRARHCTVCRRVSRDADGPPRPRPASQDGGGPAPRPALPNEPVGAGPLNSVGCVCAARAPGERAVAPSPIYFMAWCAQCGCVRYTRPKRHVSGGERRSKAAQIHTRPERPLEIEHICTERGACAV